MYKSILLVIFLTFSSCIASADVLTLGRSVSNNEHELKNLKEIGRYLIEKLDNDTYDSYEIITNSTTDNDSFIKLINSKNIDIVIEELFSSARYAAETNLEPVLLAKMADTLYLNAYIVTRNDSGIKNISDLGGKTIALMNKISTPYYFLPLQEIKKAGFKVLRIKEGQKDIPSDTVGYFFTHNKETTGNSAYLKKADAGVICSYEWNNKGNVPGFIKEHMHVIHKTNSIPGLFTLIRRDMPSRVKNKIINILSNIDKVPASRKEFTSCKITGFHKISFDWQELFKSITTEF